MAAYQIDPSSAVFVVLCFEGPDQYSQAGGLGVRVTCLAHALAEAGFETHLIFIGDPGRPGEECDCDGRLTLHRWCQHISMHYPAGVYAGEEEKLRDFSRTVPQVVLERIVEPAAAQGQLVVIMGEEWQTAETMCDISDLLHARGLRNRVVMLWNANNTMGFHRINWGRLAFTSTITTVSRYMKHLMWGVGVNPVVVPNGIPSWMLEPVDEQAVACLRASLGGDLALLKVARWDPDKRWLMAVDSVARLKERGLRTIFAVRGGVESHGGEVLHRAHALGLRVAHVTAPLDDWQHLLASISQAAQSADVLNLALFLPHWALRLFYAAADAVLANSGHEPFGLVGLEAMAVGGIVFTGATGEDYAIPLDNAIVLETEDPDEVVESALYLRAHPFETERLRHNARQTAERFTWARVLENLISKVAYVAYRQGALPSTWVLMVPEILPRSVLVAEYTRIGSESHPVPTVAAKPSAGHSHDRRVGPALPATVDSLGALAAISHKRSLAKAHKEAG